MSEILSLEGLSPEELQRLRRIASTPLGFLSNLVINYETGEKFEPNYPQRCIFEAAAQPNSPLWICIHRRGGKMQPLSSLVITPKGPRKMGDIKVGDTVCTPDGQTAKVVGLVHNDPQPVYEFTLDDGSVVESGPDHDWIVHTGLYWRGKYGEHRKVFGNRKLTSKEIAESLVYEYSNRREFQYKLNGIQPVAYEAKNLPVDPYLLGVLLGDGHFRSRVITSADPEIIDRIRERTGLCIELKKATPSKLNNKARHYAVRGLELRNSLKTLGLLDKVSDGKFVPEEYLYSSVEDRLWLLRGLMDTDGSQKTGRDGQAEFCSVSKQLADAVVMLARSLGCKATISRNVAGYTLNGVRTRTKDRFRVRITYPRSVQIFSLSRKIKPGLGERYLRRTIVGVQIKAPEPMQCLVIDHPEHLYLTDHYIPTHNCMVGDSLILPSHTLRPQPLADSQTVDQTLAFDFTRNELVLANCHWISSGEKPCVRLYFGTGVDVGVSTDHLLYVHNKGWVPAQDIRVGDKVLAPQEIPVLGTQELENTDQAAELVSISLNQRRIPDLVFLLNRRGLTQFIKAFWEAQGRSLPGYNTLCFMLHCRPMALDLHHLLLRLGVESRISEDQNLFIDDHLDQSTFLNCVGVPYTQYDVRAPRRWEIVINVRKLGLQPTYDLQVEHPDHNYVANDVVVHNSHAMTLLALYYAVTLENKRIIYFTPSQPQLEEIFNEKISGWIGANPVFSTMIDESGTNRNTPNPVRTFKTGSTIQGFILGTKEGAQEGKRGLTTDILILDEAQEYKKTDWAVVGAIMGGDSERRKRGGVKTFIPGTIRRPDGYYFRKIKKYDPSPAEARIIIPITENKDETPESIAQLKASQPPEIWNNEWLLELGDEENTIFMKDDVLTCSALNWRYGPENIGWCPMGGTGPKDEYVRVIGVDWDDTGADTNMAVIQYDPYTRLMWTIDHIVVPRGPFTLVTACEQLFDLYQQYQPIMMVADQGYGAMQWQHVYLEAPKRGLPELQQKWRKLHLGSKVEILNPETLETEKQYIKPVLVGMLHRKLQERKWLFSGLDETLKMQLLTYKKVRETNRTITYSSTNEHVIDCHLFAMYALWELFENPLMEDPEAAMAYRNLGVEKLSFRSDEEITSFWQGVDGERNPGLGGRDSLWANHRLKQADLESRTGFSSTLQDRLSPRPDLGRWLTD